MLQPCEASARGLQGSRVSGSGVHSHSLAGWPRSPVCPGGSAVPGGVVLPTKRKRIIEISCLKRALTFPPKLQCFLFGLEPMLRV